MLTIADKNPTHIYYTANVKSTGLHSFNAQSLQLFEITAKINTRWSQLYIFCQTCHSVTGAKLLQIDERLDRAENTNHISLNARL